jgi:hypothetical protein
VILWGIAFSGTEVSHERSVNEKPLSFLNFLRGHEVQPYSYMKASSAHLFPNPRPKRWYACFLFSCTDTIWRCDALACATYCKRGIMTCGRVSRRWDSMVIKKATKRGRSYSYKHEDPERKRIFLARCITMPSNSRSCCTTNR